MQNSLNTRLTCGFLLLTLFMGIVSFAIYRSITNLVSQSEWVSHTHEVLERLNEVLSNLKDIQSSQRGYVITGNILYLEPYELARPQMKDAIDKLQLLTADNPAQAARALRLGEEANKRTEVAQNIIDTYDKQSPAAAVAKIKTGLGKKEMDEARHIASEIEKEERLLLAERQRNASQAVTLTLVISGAGLLSSFLVLAFIFSIMRREIIQRRTVQDNLVQLNHHIMLVNKLGELLQSCQNLSEASAILRDYMVRLLPGTQGCIALANNSHNLIETLLTWGAEAEHFAPDFSSDECWALRSGKPHLVDHTHLNPLCPHVKQERRASLCLPMMAHGESIGLFYIAADDTHAFSDSAQDRIRVVTEQAALALSNLKLQDVLRVQSIKDPLTMLFNRRYMEATLEREISRAKRHGQSIGVIVIDLDHFKRTNDTYGHEAGDMVLKQFADLLRRTVRTEDVACRFGGEEFVVILPNISPEMAVARADALREQFGQIVMHHRHQRMGPFTFSAGVAMYPDCGDKPDDVISAADAALYKAKETRDTVVAAAPRTASQADG